MSRILIRANSVACRDSRLQKIQKIFHIPVRILVLIIFSAIFLTGCDDQNELVEIIHPPTLGPTPTLPAIAEIDLSFTLDENGRTTEELVLESSDGWVRLEIPTGTKISDASGKPSVSLNLIPVYSGQLPLDAYGYAPGFAYEYGPEEIHFEPKVSMFFLYTDEAIVGVIPSDITIGAAYAKEEWKSYGSKVDMEKREIKISVSELIPGWRYIFLAPVPIGS